VRSGTRRKREQKSLYRFAVIALSTAAAVFILLMARDLIGTRGTNGTKGSQLVSQEADGAQEENALVSEAAAEDADQETEAGAAMQEESRENEAAGMTEGADAPGETRSAQEAQSAAGTDADSGTKAAEKNAADAGSPEGEKQAVDLMGDKKGDYVSLEYISAEDQADGKSTTVPEYTPEGEEILSRAFDNGKPVPSLMANTGDPVYYVFLTKENGKVDTITFYENTYVSMDNYPGVVMRISQADYEDVMTLFR
jgi:DNA segregation ATPase FtsK/SpoIIIE-like protein